MYRTFVGLEIHIRLLTKTKIFCSCRSNFGDAPNTNVCPVCLGYPGVLPALNAESIFFAYLVARTLNCKLSTRAVFERKNYFYPDLPKNYQISQFEHPVGTDGCIEFETGQGERRIRIHDVHLEEDAGKMIHDRGRSYLDFNRAGTSLLEIVTQPDLTSGAEAEAFLQNFRRIVRYLGVCDGNMEEGSLRCDANISLNVQGKGLGKGKVEIKNLNSSRFVRMALDYEAGRQEQVLRSGREVVQETRLWNERLERTESMRGKEDAKDYRYFPEPDLLPFVPDQTFFRKVHAGMIELPLHRKKRFLREFALSAEQASFLTEEKETADFFESAAASGVSPAGAAAWLTGDVARLLNRERMTLSGSPLTVERFTAFLKLLESGRIHNKIGKKVIEDLFMENKDPDVIVNEKKLTGVTDPERIADVLAEVLAANPQAAAQLENGDRKPAGFIVGQVMKATGGKADPHVVQKLLAEKFTLT